MNRESWFPDSYNRCLENFLQALVPQIISRLKDQPQIAKVGATTNLGTVHTYPDIFESVTFSFRIRLPSTLIRRIRWRIRNFLNTLCRVDIGPIF